MNPDPTLSSMPRKDDDEQPMNPNIFSWPYPYKHDNFFKQMVLPSEKGLIDTQKKLKEEEFKRMYPNAAALNKSPFEGVDVYKKNRLNLGLGRMKTSGPIEKDKTYGPGVRLTYNF